jgi:hypothetical protein
MISTEQKLKVVEKLKLREKNYASAAKFAIVLGISQSQLSRIKKGDIENVVAPNKWIDIARKCDVNLTNRFELKPAQTDVFKYINGQLEVCQAGGLSGMLCDSADIGKTFAGRYYAKMNKNAHYIDCSQYKSKQRLVRAMARELGLNNTGRYVDVYDNLVYYIKSTPYIIFILDEFGDLDYSATLECKALWNATEYCCGWYAMGADALKAKIEGNIGRGKIGYAELKSRYGSKYQRITPHGDEADKEFSKRQTAIIAKANGVSDVQKLWTKTQGSMRRIHIEIQKLKATA